MCLRFLFASSTFVLMFDRIMATQNPTQRREALRKTHFIIVTQSSITCEIVLYRLVLNEPRKYH